MGSHQLYPLRLMGVQSVIDRNHLLDCFFYCVFFLQSFSDNLVHVYFDVPSNRAVGQLYAHRVVSYHKSQP